MTAFYYTALRDVQSGNTLGDPYSFDAQLSAKQRKPKVVKTVHTSLSGNAETVVSRREQIFTMSSLPVSGSEAEQWLEFLSSTDGGEQFQVDLTGTIASPGTLQNAIMVKDFTETYIPGFNETRFSFSFRII